MSTNLVHTAILAGVFVALFVSAEILYHRFNWKAEASRKYVHGSTGILTMLFPILLTNHWYVFALCGSFLVILLVTKKINLMQSIHAVPRITQGSILYPIIVYGCFIIYQYYDHFMFYYIPILILAISDPFAALIGTKFPKGKFKIFGHSKTLSGSLGFFFSAMVISIALLTGLEDLNLLAIMTLSFWVSVATTISEGVTHHGYDNLTIPASAIITLSITLSILNI